ncbi:hypothetical protein SAY86_021853 [Trapa natans]|uniref:Uncharacterized protein n=1 Tax=Trapa natans TaxID=22666 RepID=A0AAN7MV96_TRANT|nr:hypothetical protein SAY86_021853 [Trapa natans]
MQNLRRYGSKKTCKGTLPEHSCTEARFCQHEYIYLWGICKGNSQSSLAQVSCSLCSEMMERDILALHKGENCPQRIVMCEFCEFPLPAIDLAEHQEVCGNRTELCHLCNRYIRLRERYSHENRCSGMLDQSAGSSRDTRAAEREDNRGAHHPPREFSRKHILFTIAVTGIAILLGSFYYHRKMENSPVH